TGKVVSAGVGGTIGQDVGEGRGDVIVSSTDRGSIGSTAGTHEGHAPPGGGPGEFASTEQRGHLELKDPFLQKMVPLYNAEVSRHSLAVEKELRPTMEQIAVLDALIQKTRDQTGFWAGLENFLTDPLALVGLAGSFVSFGAGAGIAAREALKTWSTEK